MKLFLRLFPLLASAALAVDTGETIVLGQAAVQSLGLETVEASETAFEETAYTLGRIRVAPGHRAVVSSRIAGRAIDVDAHIDTTVKKGETVLSVESRQPGDPPPVVKLVAPISGLVSAVNIAPGQPVEPDASLIEIVNLHTVHAVAAVPEYLAGRLKHGQQARIRVAGVPDREFLATVEHFGAEADAEAGTIEAAFHVDNPDLLLRPGMRAEFAIILGRRENVMSVPREAVQGDAANRVVYVKHFDLPDSFIRTPVKIGQSNDSRVEILGGLFPGDEVVTKGAYMLGFAGGSGPSLKEALDAAHGHEHNEDGSEMTAAQRAAKAAANRPGEQQAPSPFVTRFFMATTALLLVLLIVMSFAKRRAVSSDERDEDQPRTEA
jgi:cobalt-zinc-cadmium efflux system membrane fusion protein